MNTQLRARCLVTLSVLLAPMIQIRCMEVASDVDTGKNVSVVALDTMGNLQTIIFSSEQASLFGLLRAADRLNEPIDLSKAYVHAEALMLAAKSSAYFTGAAPMGELLTALTAKEAFRLLHAVYCLKLNGDPFKALLREISERGRDNPGFRGEFFSYASIANWLYELMHLLPEFAPSKSALEWYTQVVLPPAATLSGLVFGPYDPRDNYTFNHDHSAAVVEVKDCHRKPSGAAVLKLTTGERIDIPDFNFVRPHCYKFSPSRTIVYFCLEEQKLIFVNTNNLASFSVCGVNPTFSLDENFVAINCNNGSFCELFNTVTGEHVTTLPECYAICVSQYAPVLIVGNHPCWWFIDMATGRQISTRLPIQPGKWYQNESPMELSLDGSVVFLKQFDRVKLGEWSNPRVVCVNAKTGNEFATIPGHFHGFDSSGLVLIEDDAGYKQAYKVTLAGGAVLVGEGADK